MNSAKTMRNLREKGAEWIFIIASAMSVVSVLLICWFIFSNSFPALKEIGVMNFLTGTVWQPSNGHFGILPMIVGSLYVTAGAAILGVPIGVMVAVYMAYYCPKKLYGSFRAGINLLAGIPSVVYGLWALEVIVPAIRAQFGGFGLSVLAAILLLAIMILPTIISLSLAALRSVPEFYYTGAIALGASKERTIFTVMIPAATSGIMSSVILGIGRAIGETMAVQMIIGNQTLMPSSLIKGARTLTTNIVIEMSYAEGLHREALIATGAVLFIFILLINIGFYFFKKKGAKE